MDDEVSKEEARLLRAFNNRGKTQVKAKTTPEWKRRQRERDAEAEAKRKADAAEAAAKKEEERIANEAKMEAIRNGTYVEPEAKEEEAPAKEENGVCTESTITSFSAQVDEDAIAKREEERLMRLMSPRGGSGKPVI